MNDTQYPLYHIHIWPVKYGCDIQWVNNVLVILQNVKKIIEVGGGQNWLTTPVQPNYKLFHLSIFLAKQ